MLQHWKTRTYYNILQHTTTYYNFITLKMLETMLYNVSFAQTTGISKHGGGDFYDQPVWVVSWFWNYWFWNWFGTGFGVGLEINHWFFQLFSIFPYFHHWFFQLFSAAWNRAWMGWFHPAPRTPNDDFSCCQLIYLGYLTLSFWQHLTTSNSWPSQPLIFFWMWSLAPLMLDCQQSLCWVTPI